VTAHGEQNTAQKVNTCATQIHE